MRKLITLLFAVMALGASAQIFSSDALNHLKPVDRSKAPKRQITLDPSRAITNIAIDYDSFDRKWAVQNSPDEMNLFSWAINNRNTVDSVFTLDYAVVTFDTLIDVNNNFAGTPKQGTTARLDSFDIILSHANFSGANDTLIVSVFDKNTATVTGTGVTSNLNTVSLWADTIIYNDDFFPTDSLFYFLTYSPNVTLPTGHVAGIKIEFRGPVQDQLSVLASFREHCGPTNFQTIIADTNKAAPRNSSYYLNLQASSGFVNYAANLAVNGTSACKYFYIQNFWVFPYMTLNTTAGATQATVVTNAATNVASTTATLNGSVNANGSSTAVTFEYGTTTAYGQTATATPSPVTGSTATLVSANIAGLTANTLYHFRVKGVNGGGTANGNDLTFTTLAAGTVCTPDPNTPTFGPTSDNVPCIQQGVSFSQTYTFVVPALATSVRIDSVVNLPAGLTAQASKNPPLYTSNERGCLLVTGTTNAACGQYQMLIYVTIVSGLGTQQGELSALGGAFGFTKVWLRVIGNGGTCPAVDANQTAIFAAGSCGLVSITATANATSVNCFGGATGTATVTANGGSNYSYLWSNGQTSATATGLIAGTYTVTVTSGNATATATATVTQPASALTVTATTTPNTGGNNGGVNTTATGGTGTYLYVWSNGATSADLTNVAPGAYTVTVTDQNGCTASGTYTVANLVGINNIELVNKFSVFPNPASTMVNVQVSFTETTDTKIELMDLTGKVVLTENTGKTNQLNRVLNVSSIPAGVYAIRVSGAKFNVVKQLTISK